MPRKKKNPQLYWGDTSNPNVLLAVKQAQSTGSLQTPSASGPAKELRHHTHLPETFQPRFAHNHQVNTPVMRRKLRSRQGKEELLTCLFPCPALIYTILHQFLPSGSSLYLNSPFCISSFLCWLCEKSLSAVMRLH